MTTMQAAGHEAARLSTSWRYKPALMKLRGHLDFPAVTFFTVGIVLLMHGIRGC